MPHAAEAPIHTATGYCEPTTFTHVMNCAVDDKGSFSWAGGQTWDKALEACRAACLGCARCNFISVSLEWKDCSWYHACDMDNLRADVAGFKSAVVRSAAKQESPTMDKAHEAYLYELWTSLRTGFQAPAVSTCWPAQCGGAPHNDRARLHVALGMSSQHEAWASDAGCNGAFFHSWAATEHFFACVVLPHLLRAPRERHEAPSFRHVYIPAHCPQGEGNAPGIVFRELAALFAGRASRMAITRSPGVPHCPPRWEVADDTCCGGINATDTLRHRLGLAGSTQLLAAELRPQQPYAPDALRPAMRSVVWANLGVLDAPADTFLFVSNEGATNMRRIADEASVAAAVERVVRARAPRLTFRYQRLEALSLENEVRLIRRTRYMAVLFGASISHCRFLPLGALVLQLHGALKGETAAYAALSQYQDVCERSQLVVRLVGYAVPGWHTRYPEDASSPHLMTAAIPPRQLAHWVGRVFNESEVPAMQSEFVAAIRRDSSGPRLHPKHRT